MKMVKPLVNILSSSRSPVCHSSFLRTICCYKIPIKSSLNTNGTEISECSTELLAKWCDKQLTTQTDLSDRSRLTYRTSFMSQHAS